MPRVYIESQVTVRDLLSRILLGLQILNKSTFIDSIVIGRNGKIQSMVKFDQGFAYIADNFSIPAKARFEKIRPFAARIYAFCDESTALNNEPLYLQRRANKISIQNCDHIFATSNYHRDLLTNAYPELEKKISNFGLPRFDFLKDGCRTIYDAQVNNLKGKYGEYILMPSNGARGRYLQIDQLLKKLLGRGEINDNQVDEFVNYYKNLNDSAEQFDQAAISLAEMHKGLNFVYRGKPHSEYSAFEKNKLPENLFVESSLSVHPWILGAAAVVHQNCTTGIEAFVAGISSVDFIPRTLQHISKAPHALTNCAHTIDQLSDFLGGDKATIDKKISPGDVSYFFGDLENYSSEKIANFIASDFRQNVGIGDSSNSRIGANFRRKIRSFSAARYVSDKMNFNGRGGDIRSKDVHFYVEKILQVMKPFSNQTSFRVKWHDREVFELNKKGF